MSTKRRQPGLRGPAESSKRPHPSKAKASRPVSEETKAKLEDLHEQLGDLQESLLLTGIKDEIEDVQTRLALLPSKIEELRNRKNIDPQQMLIEVAMAQQNEQRKMDARIEQLKQERDKKINKIETELALQVDAVSGGYKLGVVIFPPIPPLVIGLIVFFSRRAREREGVASERLR